MKPQNRTQQLWANYSAQQQQQQQPQQPQDAAADNGLLSLIPFFDNADRLLSGQGVKWGDMALDVASILPLGTIARGAKAATKAVRSGDKVFDAVRAATIGQEATKGGRIAQKVAKGKEAVQDTAAANLLGLSPAQAANLANEGVDITKLGQRAAQYGADPISIIGKKGKGGPLQATIKSLEEGIQRTVTTTGRNVRISGDEVIKALKAQRTALKRELGGGTRLKQLDKIIADAERKYKKGVTVRQALGDLRQANARFGASILDESGDAIARASQKLEANTLRDVLKSRFPTIAKGLDDQSELIQLREVLSKARGKQLSGKYNLRKFDLTKPGSWADPVLNSNRFSQRALGGGAPSRVGGAANRAFSPVATGLRSPAGMAGVQSLGMLGGGQQEQPQDLQSAIMSAQGITSATPTPQPQTSQSPYSREALMSDIQRDPQNADKYIEYFTMLDEVFNSAQNTLDLNNTAVQSITDLQTGLDNLGALEQRIMESGANNPFIGEIRSRIPFDTDAASLRAEIDRVKQVVGKALEGGVLRKEDEEKYKKILPTINDTDAVAIQKIAAIRADLQNKLNTYLSNQQQYGGGGSVYDAVINSGVYQ